MHQRGSNWVIILAAGEGQRVRALTVDDHGSPVPKQFCAVDGSSTMLGWTVERALRLVPRERIVAVVAEQHADLWSRELSALDPDLIAVQPENRGTAAGVFLPFSEVLRRDPGARILVLPSDHYVRDEERFCAALDAGVRAVEHGDDRVVLFGMHPRRFGADYGWILPSREGDPRAVRAVDVLAEGPDDAAARELMRRGALINTNAFVARAATLLRLYEHSASWLAEQFLQLEADRPDHAAALRGLYHTLPRCDFWTEVLARVPDMLAVLPVPECGWADLGSPARLKIFRSRGHLHPDLPIGPPGSWFG